MLTVQPPCGVHGLRQPEPCHCRSTEGQGTELHFPRPVLLRGTPSFQPGITSPCLGALFCQPLHSRASCDLQRQRLLPAEKCSAVPARKDTAQGNAFHKPRARRPSPLAVQRLQFYCRNHGPRHEPRAPQQYRGMCSVLTGSCCLPHSPGICNGPRPANNPLAAWSLPL